MTTDYAIVTHNEAEYEYCWKKLLDLGFEIESWSCNTASYILGNQRVNVCRCY